MRYLLDTSIFLWALGAEHKLNQKARDLISSHESELYLSAASSWEIAIKFALGALTLPSPPGQFVPNAIALLGIRTLDITPLPSLRAGELPPHHRDPFDHMLIAQARLEDMVLLTADRALLKYDVNSLFCGK